MRQSLAKKIRREARRAANREMNKYLAGFRGIRFWKRLRVVWRLLWAR
jgi:hypothetical protein